MRVNCSLGNLDPLFIYLALMKIIFIKHWNVASGLNSGAFLLVFSHILDLFFSSYIREDCKLLVGMYVLSCYPSQAGSLI